MAERQESLFTVMLHAGDLLRVLTVAQVGPNSMPKYSNTKIHVLCTLTHTDTHVHTQAESRASCYRELEIAHSCLSSEEQRGKLRQGHLDQLFQQDHLYICTW